MSTFCRGIGQQQPTLSEEVPPFNCLLCWDFLGFPLTRPKYCFSQSFGFQQSFGVHSFVHSPGLDWGAWLCLPGVLLPPWKQWGWIESDVHWGYDLDFDPWPLYPVAQSRPFDLLVSPCWSSFSHGPKSFNLLFLGPFGQVSITTIVNYPSGLSSELGRP